MTDGLLEFRVAASFLFASGGGGGDAECGVLACFQGVLGVEEAEELDKLGDGAGPAGLVAGADAGAVVAVEVLIEQDVVAPVGIVLELLGVAVNGSAAVCIAGEGPDKPVGDLLADL